MSIAIYRILERYGVSCCKVAYDSVAMASRLCAYGSWTDANPLRRLVTMRFPIMRIGSRFGRCVPSTPLSESCMPDGFEGAS